MSSITHSCEKCGNEMRIHQRYFGRELKCTRCGQPFTVGEAAALDDTAGEAPPDTKLCPYCAEEIKAAAVICRHCQRNLEDGSHPSDGSLKRLLPAILGYLGAALLAVGVFLPIVKVPIMGTINYFGNGKGDGMIILALAVLGLLFTAGKRYALLFIPALTSLGMCAWAIYNFTTALESAKAKLVSDMKDNPFGGIAQVAAQSVQLQWGWIVLVIGALLMLAGAAAGLNGKKSAVAGLPGA